MPWGRSPQDPDPFEEWGEGPSARPRGRGASGEPWVGDGGSDGLDDAFARAAARAVERLSRRLEGLISRRVPVRGISPGPLGGIARLRFADGTAVLVRSARQGDLSRVARTLTTRRSMVLAGYDAGPEGVLLTLHGAPGREPVGLVLIGPDQPD